MYNGVKLPALPEYDTDAYPYAYIAKNLLIDGAYALFISDGEFIYDKTTNTMIRAEGSIVLYCTCRNDAWNSEFNDFTSDSLLAPIWANYNVKDTNGNVHMAASKPKKMWENARSFLIGLAMGLVGKPLPLPQVQVEQESYIFDAGSGTLTIYKDDGSLSYSFSDESLRLTVSEV
jgi:hypothetical protein